MRSYAELTSAIIRAIPTPEEIAALSDEQIQTLRKYGNTFDNVLYIQTRDWKERSTSTTRHDPKNKELKI